MNYYLRAIDLDTWPTHFQCPALTYSPVCQYFFAFPLPVVGCSSATAAGVELIVTVELIVRVQRWEAEAAACTQVLVRVSLL